MFSMNALLALHQSAAQYTVGFSGLLAGAMDMGVHAEERACVSLHCHRPDLALGPEQQV